MQGFTGFCCGRGRLRYVRIIGFPVWIFGNCDGFWLRRIRLLAVRRDPFSLSTPLRIVEDFVQSNIHGWKMNGWLDPSRKRVVRATEVRKSPPQTRKKRCAGGVCVFRVSGHGIYAIDFPQRLIGWIGFFGEGAAFLLALRNTCSTASNLALIIIYTWIEIGGERWRYNTLKIDVMVWLHFQAFNMGNTSLRLTIGFHSASVNTFFLLRRTQHDSISLYN